MDHIGIGEYEKESQICIIPEGDELIEKRIHTEPERSGGVTNGAVGNTLVPNSTSGFGSFMNQVVLERRRCVR